jgi:phospholipid-binding lipoprotein MlaA
MNPTTMLSRFTIATGALALAGCATTAPPSRVDPLEPFNRAMYAVHEPIDTNIVRPVIQAYVDHVPRAIRQPIANFFGNIEDFFSGVNGLLQNKPDKAGHDFGRVIVNSFFGLGGLIDFASEAGIPRGEEDFGQTFGVWGFPQGPYLFIPLFGPTTVRDGSGWLVRYFVGPVGYIDEQAVRLTLYGIGYVDIRAQTLEAQTLIDRAALDRYTFVRRSYLQRREYLTYDGKPPQPKDEE